MHVGSGRDNYGTYYHDNNPQKQQEFRVQKEDFPALGEAAPGPKPLSQQGPGKPIFCILGRENIVSRVGCCFGFYAAEISITGVDKE